MKSISVLTRLAALTHIVRCLELLLLMFLSLPTQASDGELTFANPRFSSDGQKLSFSLCEKRGCKNAVYNIGEDRFYSYRDISGKPIVYAAFSPSGKQTALLYGESLLWPIGAKLEQIAVGDSQGKAFEPVTASKTLKRYPVFWDEENILFTGQEATGDKTRFKHVSILNLASKTERKITSDEFYGPSGPVPVGDGEHFVMAEFGYSRSQVSPFDRNRPSATDEVLLVSVKTGEITLVNTGIVSSSAPAIAVKQIYFVGRLEKESKKNWYFIYDIFMHGDKGPKRVTHLAEYISDMDVTSDARYLAVVTKKANRNVEPQKLLIYDMQNKEYRRLIPNHLTDVIVKIENWRDK